MLSRRSFIGASLSAAGLALLPRELLALRKGIAVTVYKTTTCGCCKEWVKHIEKNGFTAKVVDLTADQLDLQKKALGVPARLASCHTGVVGDDALQGRVFEGHVPADLMKRFLAEKRGPTIGLAVPGMPASAPGMDMEPHQAYDVLAFTRGGQTSVYAKR